MLCVAKREYEFQKNGLKGIAIGRIKKRSESHLLLMQKQYEIFHH